VNLLPAALALYSPATPRPTSFSPRAASPVCQLAGSRGNAHETLLALLQQRAIQTQLFFNREFKNDCPRKWLERYVDATGGPSLFQPSGQTVHAADALMQVGAKDSFLLGMMGAPDETHNVVVIWGNRVGGGSRNNPYLQTKKQTQTYTETISPARIAWQLMALRESIAHEWVEDLRLFKLDNDELRRHHAEEVRSLVDHQERFEYAITPGSGGEDTPLRASSYDLLKTAATRCAFRRLHSELDRDSLQRHSAEWMRVFLEARASPLSGQVGWHAARDFLLDLMAQPVSVGTSPGGNARFLDPLALAERVLDLRIEIADEWTEALEAVPDGHLRLARLRLEAREVQQEQEAIALARMGEAPKGFEWGGIF